ncbi:MAG TPA: carbohydrate ABC transporter permease, partial [Sphaerochaeta sp.]|nr:carbohydrate ABC transporter permease [Sphaerochaeta sp.]
MKLSKTNRAVKYILAVIAAFLFLFPLYVIINNSLKPFADVRVSEMWVLARSPSSEGFSKAFKALRQNLINSFILVIPVSLLSVLF